ncbi:PaaI family thioesterase [Candidatus Parvarchaeota archaeon]|jgi:uncharacterized domain 1|nr:PaaI family thioesterase [Candidatus Parvarchaeota archaeon]
MDNKAIRQVIESDPFLKYVGVKVLVLKEGYCKISVDFREELTRFGGLLNGGAIATLADAAGGCSVLTLNDGSNQVTAQLDISFLKPIRSGPVIAEANVIKKGKSLSFADVQVYDGDGDKCAVAKGIWFFVGVRT